MKPLRLTDIPERLRVLAAGAPNAHIPTKRKAKATPRPKCSEADLQAQAEELCAALGLRFFRLPDTLLAHLAQSHEAWVRVFCGRYLKGLPDLLLFRPLPGGDNLCRMLEIKREDGRLRQGQREWHKGLDVRVAYGWPEVEREIATFAREEVPQR